MKTHETSCKEKVIEEKRKLITILSSSDIVNNSRLFSTQTKSIKSQKSEDAAEIENLNVFYLNKNSSLIKVKMCIIQVMSMLTSKVKTELTAAILTLNKVRDIEDLKFLKDLIDKLSAIIFKAEEVFIHTQLSEYKRETDQKINKLLILITLLTKNQSLFKTLKSFSDFLSADISKEEKLKTIKTIKITIKTLKLSKIATLKIKIIYVSKITENTQQIEKS